MKKERSLNSLILSGLGKAWMYWPPRLEAKARAKHPTKKGWWICENCKQERERIEIDHKIPCVKLDGSTPDWTSYIRRRFVESAAELSALCRDCHREKTQGENKVRRLCKKLKRSVSKRD